MQRLCLLLCLAAPLLGACSEPAASRDVNLDFDLTRGHDLDDVNWPEDRRDRSATELKPVDQVVLRLPGRRPMTVKRLHDVALARSGQRVTTVQLDADPASPERAHARAVDWARELGLDVERLDRWLAELRGAEGPERARLLRSRPATGGGARGVRLGEDGPRPVVEIRSSPAEETPSIASLSLLW